MSTQVRLLQRWLSLLLIVLTIIPLAHVATPLHAEENPQLASEDEQLTPADEQSPQVRVRDQAIFGADDTFDSPEQASSTKVSDTPQIEFSPEYPAAITIPTGNPNIVVDARTVLNYRAGELITYTYAYTNTGADAANLRFDIVWSNFKYNQTSTAVLWCATQTPQQCAPENVQGPAVSYVGKVTDGIRVAVDMPANSTGRFSVILQSSIRVFPKSTTTVLRPSSSIRVAINGQPVPNEDDTVSTLLIGPVIALIKNAVPEDRELYPGETVIYRITLQNLPRENRPDTINATNIVFTDVLPLGTEVVSSSIPYQQVPMGLQWNIGNLNVGQAWIVEVAFRRLDVVPNAAKAKESCSVVNNELYYVSTNEFPVINGERQVVYGDEAEVPVVVPIQVKFSAPRVNLGAEVEATLEVENYWDQPITGLRLEYNIQENAEYIGPANPPLTTEPVTPSGTIGWTFDMEAGTKEEPAVKEFKFRLRMGLAQTSPANGSAIKVILPNGSSMPTACIDGIINETNTSTYGPSVRTRPRLEITVKSDDTLPKLGSNYLVERGDIIPVIITITNNSAQPALLTDVTFHFSNADQANFAYVENSSLVDGAPRAPDTVQNNVHIIWNNVAVPASGQTTIEFNLNIIDGIDVLTYCHFVDGNTATEFIGGFNTDLCVQINPDIDATKTANKESGAPGEVVEFELTLTNNEPEPYEAGLFDILGSFIFIDQVSGYADPQAIVVGGQNALVWPRKLLEPGETISAVIRARLPGSPTTSCFPKNVVNEAGYSSEDDLLIIFVPPVEAVVRLVCNQFRYSMDYEFTPVSLRDRFAYTINLDNQNETGPINSVVVTTILPLAFEYVEMSVTSDITSEPAVTTTPSGTLQLVWNIPSIPADEITEVEFYARSGESIGKASAYVRATSNQASSVCRTRCKQIFYQGNVETFSLRDVDVLPLITAEPSIVNAPACVEPGQRITYQIQLFSTHEHHGYPDTAVNVYLPPGVKYLGTSRRRIPLATLLPDGRTKVSWVNLDVPQSPRNGSASVLMDMDLEIDNTWEDVRPTVQALSDYGSIPLKSELQGVAPAITVCPQQPAISKLVNHTVARVGDTVVYQIVVANTNPTELTATIQDELPANMSFLGMLSGPAPTTSGNTLTWNVAVPGITGAETKRTVVLLFNARVDSVGAIDTAYTNTATVSQSSAQIDTTYASATYVVPRVLFFPTVQGVAVDTPGE